MTESPLPQFDPGTETRTEWAIRWGVNDMLAPMPTEDMARAIANVHPEWSPAVVSRTVTTVRGEWA